MRQLGKVGEVCTVDENVGEVSLRGFTPHYIVGPNRGAPPPPRDQTQCKSWTRELPLSAQKRKKNGANDEQMKHIQYKSSRRYKASPGEGVVESWGSTSAGHKQAGPRGTCAKTLRKPSAPSIECVKNIFFFSLLWVTQIAYHSLVSDGYRQYVYLLV